MSILSVLIFVANLLISLTTLTVYLGDYILYTYLVIFVYAIGYWGYKQGRIFTYQDKTTKKEKPQKPQYTKEDSSSISKEDQLFIEKFISYMENEKPYTNCELNLYDLSKNFDVSTTYLSYILNACLHVNFYQFINKYRVEETQRRLKNNDTKKFTLLTIAFESGFNSKASFNRIFKDVSGMTPSQFQKSVA